MPINSFSKNSVCPIKSWTDSLIDDLSIGAVTIASICLFWRYEDASLSELYELSPDKTDFFPNSKVALLFFALIIFSLLLTASFILLIKLSCVEFLIFLR